MNKSTQQLLEVCHIIRQEYGGDFFENRTWFISRDLYTTFQEEFGFEEPVKNNSGKEIKVFAGIYLYFNEYEDFEYFEKQLLRSNITKNLTLFTYLNPFGDINCSVLVAISFDR